MMILWIILGFLVVYHHVGWPMLLRFLAKRTSTPEPPDASDYHTITLIIPVHNEQDVIEAKLWNLTILDYPHDKLNIMLVCDGCTDDTEAIIKNTLTHAAFENLNIKVDLLEDNHGKLAILNAYIPVTESDIIALSDCSALLSADSLHHASRYFQDASVGVVCSTYHMQHHGSNGEAHYWEYQRTIKQCEATIGSVIGAHGAFYLFRSEHFQPLDVDIINDDFILPMQIVGKGFKALYAPEMVALELECADLSLDWNRRKRIGAGNMQQVLRLLYLLHPKYRMIAVSFFSGKVLRTLMPFLLVAFFLLTGMLSMQFPLLFTPVLLAQIAVYALGVVKVNRSLCVSLHYLVVGHAANLIGSVRYIAGVDKERWKRVE